jgi:H+-transporting ATPase
MITRRSVGVHETEPSAVVHDGEQSRDELEAEMQEVESEVQKLQAQLAHLQYPQTRRRSNDSRSSDIHRKASASDIHRTPSEGEIVRRLSVDVNSVVVETKRKDSLTHKEGAHGDKGTSRSRSGGPPGPEEDEDHKGEKVVKFEQAPHDGLTASQAEALLLKWGKNELQEKITPWYVIVFRLLTGPMPIMLWIAALVEAIIGAYADMGILLAIQFTNAGISFYETTKAGNAVAALKASLQPKATVKRDGKWFDIDATLIVPGDLVLLAAGSAVPADCYVNDGEIEVDQSAMTGESLPVKMRRGNVCKLGSNVVRGETEGTVETTGEHTFFGKTASMLQSVNSDGGSLQILLLRIMLILVSLSLTLCIIALIFLIVEGRKQNELRPEAHRKEDSHIVKEALSFAVVVLVASIPLAIEIVTTTTLALGSKDLSAKGCIVTRLSAIEEMAGMDMLCSDKTGTLTLNKVSHLLHPPSPFSIL